MSMPQDLVLVRHGQSEGNIANRASRKGDDSYFTEEFRGRHSSTWRLTPKGRGQAKKAGVWIKKNINEGVFDGYFVSSYTRARETAALLNLPQAEWRIEDQLREQEWGLLDVMPQKERLEKYPEIMKQKEINSFYWPALSGESMPNLIMRIRTGILDTLHREYSGKKVIIVAHGNTMWAFRYILERMLPEKYVALEKSDDPFEKINNCQIIHYSRLNPETKEVEKYLNWKRSVCPWDPKKSSNKWVQIKRRRYSNKELLESIQ